MNRYNFVLTAADVALELGISKRRVLQLAHSRSVGSMPGRDWLFTPEEVDALRVRKIGRPRKLS